MNNVPVFWKRFAFILVGLNLVLLVVLFLRAPNTRISSEEPHRSGKGPGEFIIKVLKLNPDQVVLFSQLKEQHRDSMNFLREEAHNLRSRFFEKLKSGQQLDDEALLKIAQNQSQIEGLTYRHFMSVRQLCNDKQLELFNQNIDEVLNQMSHRHP